MDMDVRRPKWPFFQFQKFGPSEEIPSVVVDSFEIVASDCSCDFVCGLCCLGGSR